MKKRVMINILFVFVLILCICSITNACDCSDWEAHSGLYFVKGYATTFCVFLTNCSPYPLSDTQIDETKPVLGPLFDSFTCICGSTGFPDAQFKVNNFYVGPYTEYHYHLIKCWSELRTNTMWDDGSGGVCYSDYNSNYVAKGNDPYELIINFPPTICN